MQAPANSLRLRRKKPRLLLKKIMFLKNFKSRRK
jgi:hypothetical protein